MLKKEKKEETTIDILIRQKLTALIIIGGTITAGIPSILWMALGTGGLIAGATIVFIGTNIVAAKVNKALLVNEGKRKMEIGQLVSTEAACIVITIVTTMLNIAIIAEIG